MVKKTATKRKVKPKTPRKNGRPTTYTPKAAALICSLLAEGLSLRKICTLENMPRMSTVMQWLFNPSDFRDCFMEQYRRASMKRPLTQAKHGTF